MKPMLAAGDLFPLPRDEVGGWSHAVEGLTTNVPSVGRYVTEEVSDREMMVGVGEAVSSRGLLDKLGVRPGSRVSVLRVEDRAFLTELAERGADVSRGRRRKRSDLIFLGIDASGDLARLGSLEPYLERNGGVWVVYPKGRKDLKEVDVIRAGVGVGLVDNKVVRFSDTHTALRFVIPKARR